MIDGFVLNKYIKKTSSSSQKLKRKQRGKTNESDQLTFIERKFWSRK